VRAVVQRVRDAKVLVGGAAAGSVDRGLLVYLGVAVDDGEADAAWMAEKVAELRIFEDEAGIMNRSAREEGAGALVVSQFTLLADARKGRRPSYSDAAPPETARPLYESFVGLLRGRLVSVETGVFQAEMQVAYTNDGPVTILLDSKKLF
jgi:D-tyrosyl-tRNA(Tyr) deacylase